MHKHSLLRATLQQLRAFEASARLLSITGAAESLHTSQPTVSIQLKELAENIGLPLFDYQGKQLRLTEAGRELQITVRDIFATWELFESRIAELKGLQRGRLRLAAVTTAEYLLPQLLGPFCQKFPGIEVELVVENRDVISQRIEQGLDDLTMMTVIPAQLKLQVWPFVENPLVVIASAHSPFAKQGLIKLPELIHERWLLREEGSGGRELVEAHFEKKKFHPAVTLSMGSNEAIKHAVAGGLGLSILSRHTLGGNPAAHGLRELNVAGFPIPGHFNFVLREGRRLSPVAQAFLEFAQQRV